MSRSTPRPTMPFSAIGRTEAFAMAPMVELAS